MTPTFMSQRTTEVPSAFRDDLNELRAAQHEDQRRLKDIQARIRKRAKRIEVVLHQIAIAAKLRRFGVKRPLMVIREAEVAGVAIYDALAMLQMETGIPQHNVFGCDHGICSTAPWCHQKVTAARVDALLRSGEANGVGWTQITLVAFVLEAERLGGAHRPRNQMRIGFRVLRENQVRLGRQEGFRAYNGTGPAAEEYGRKAIELADIWNQRDIPDHIW